MRYLVRDAEGRELTVPSLADLARLHRQGFLADDDLVRRETTGRWERVADLALAAPAARGRPRRGARWLLVAFAAVALVAALALLRAARA